MTRPTPSAPASAILDNVARFVAIDFEMTGHAPPSYQKLERASRFARFPGVIIEIGAVAYCRQENGFVRAGEYYSLVNPDGPISPSAIQVHGIKTGRLKTAPRFKEIADALLEFIADSALVAHSYHNDRDALDYELARAGRQGWRDHHYPTDRFICTQSPFQRAYPDRRASSLDIVCDRLWIDRSDRFAAHGALLDAELTSEALLKIAGLLPIRSHEAA